MTTPAPGALALLLSAPGALVGYYLRLARMLWLAARGGDVPARARRWAEWAHALRPEPSGAVMAQLDFWALCLVRRKAPARVSLLLLALPLRAALAARRAAATYGPGVRDVHGVAVLTQALEMWHLQLCFPIAFPKELKLYYAHELYTSGRRGDAGFILGALHQNLLAEAINDATAGVMDKREFARRCAGSGLAHIPSIAEVDPDGSVRWLNDTGGLPGYDLFSKPALEANGTGAARWIRRPDGRYRAEDGRLLDEAAVLAELRSIARRGPVLVQPRLRNHPEIERRVGDTVATVRFACLLLPDGAFEPVLAIQRSAPADASVDNSARGGIACAVDLGSGELGPAARLGRAGLEFSAAHPRTGLEVAGVRLPFWEETLELIERAHRVFHHHPLIGWDVAITPAGPVLVEANIIWNARALQSAHRVALGRLPYAARLLQLLERLAPATEARPAPSRGGRDRGAARG